MADFRIAIIGLGVTGTSLGLALKKASAELRITGHDRQPAAAAAAHKAGAVDRTQWNLPAACDGADLVILALPMEGVRETLAVIGPALKAGCLVTDTAPVKAPVLAWAEESLPREVSFVGGDPVGARGRRLSPSAEMFRDTVYCLCPGARAPAGAIDRAADLAQAVGARPRFFDAVEHDGLAAALDQLPVMLSLAALRAMSDSPAWREIVTLGGGRFLQLLMAQGGTATEGVEVAAANREQVDRWLAAAQDALQDLRDLLAAAPEERQASLARLQEAREAWDRGDTAAPQPKTDYRGVGVRRLFGLR